VRRVLHDRKRNCIELRLCLLDLLCDQFGGYLGRRNPEHAGHDLARVSSELINRNVECPGNRLKGLGAESTTLLRSLNGAASESGGFGKMFLGPGTLLAVVPDIFGDDLV